MQEQNLLFDIRWSIRSFNADQLHLPRDRTDTTFFRISRSPLVCSLWPFQRKRHARSFVFGKYLSYNVNDVPAHEDTCSLPFERPCKRNNGIVSPGNKNYLGCSHWSSFGTLDPYPRNLLTHGCAAHTHSFQFDSNLVTQHSVRYSTIVSQEIYPEHLPTGKLGPGYHIKPDERRPGRLDAILQKARLSKTYRGICGAIRFRSESELPPVELTLALFNTCKPAFNLQEKISSSNLAASPRRAPKRPVDNMSYGSQLFQGHNQKIARLAPKFGDYRFPPEDSQPLFEGKVLWNPFVEEVVGLQTKISACENVPHEERGDGPPECESDEKVLHMCGFPETDDVERFVEDMPGLSKQNFNILRNALSNHLLKIRFEALAFVSEYRSIALRQSSLQKIGSGERRKHLCFVVNQFFQARKHVVLKFREYVCNRKRIENIATRQRRGCLSNRQNNYLRHWLFSNFDNPYPDLEKKRGLIACTDLSLTQVNNWLINARSRVWKPTVEIMSSESAARVVLNGEDPTAAKDCLR